MADPNVRFSSEATKGVVWMSPRDYLALSPSMKDPHAGDQAKSLKESLDSGEPIYAAPAITISDGKVVDQDGRHRALAAQSAGIRMIPVKVDGEIPKDGRLMGMMGKAVQLDAGALQPKTWKEVSKSAEYQKLSSDDQEKAKRQYFNQVIAPRVSKQDQEAAAQQFQQQADARVAPTRVDPTEGMSGYERAAAGFGKAFHDIGLGVRSMLPESVGGTKPGEVEEARLREAPLMHTGMGRAGNIAGAVTTALPAAFIPGANTVAGSAALGALYGGIQPATSWSERAGNALEGGLVSGGITGAARAVPAAYRALVDPFTSSGQDRIALDVIGRFAKDPNALSPSARGASELVPGSRGTLAEVTGDPGIAQLQRAATAASPETANAMATARTARLQARKDALMKIAGDDYEKEFFEAARESTAQRLYGDAFKAKIDPAAAKAAAPEISALLKRPSIQAAQADALRIAKEEGVNLTPSKLKSGSIESLHYMKKSLDGMISKAKASGDSAEASRLLDTQKKLLGVMDDLSPAYRDARAEYAAASKPINRMEIGRYLYDKLIPALSDLGAERITPAKFAESLKQGDAMAQRATGFKGAKLADILSSDDMKSLVNLGLDLGRETRAAEQGLVKGSPTAQYLAGRNAMRQITGPLGMPDSWSEHVLSDTLANRWVSLAAKPVESKVQERLSNMLLDPRAYDAAAAARAARANTPVNRLLDFSSQRVLPPTAVGIGANAANGQ